MEVGESIVAAYLQHVRRCEPILTNVYLSGEQGEIDVVGLERGEPPRVWLCEVTTHIRGGMNNPAKRPAAQRVTEKVERAIAFAEDLFPSLEAHVEIWSPLIRPGILVELDAVTARFRAQGVGVAIVANEAYTERVQELVTAARGTASTTGNDAFRMLQILTRLKGGLEL